MKQIHQPNSNRGPKGKKTLSAAAMREARMVFDRFDEDGGGAIGITEMCGALKQMGIYGYSAAGPCTPPPASTEL